MDAVEALQSRPVGAIAQLGERNTGSVEVGGSIPPGSTSFKLHQFHAPASKPVNPQSPSSSRPRTLPFHGGNRGSNPLGDARFVLCRSFPAPVGGLGAGRGGGGKCFHLVGGGKQGAEIVQSVKVDALAKQRPAEEAGAA